MVMVMNSGEEVKLYKLFFLWIFMMKELIKQGLILIVDYQAKVEK